METFTDIPGSPTRKVAESLLFVGRNGHDSHKHLPYSCVRIDVQDGRPLKFIVKPLVAERIGEQWYNHQPEPFMI